MEGDCHDNLEEIEMLNVWNRSIEWNKKPKNGDLWQDVAIELVLIL